MSKTAPTKICELEHVYKRNGVLFEVNNECTLLAILSSTFKTVHLIAIEHNNGIKLRYQNVIEDVLIIKQKLYVIMLNNFIEYNLPPFDSLKDFNIKGGKTRMFPGLKFIYPLEPTKDGEYNFMYICHETYYTGSPNCQKTNFYETYYLQSNHLFMVGQNSTTVYEKFKGLVYCDIGTPNYHADIRNNKIYKLITANYRGMGFRLLGRDLNLYIDDLSCRKHFEPSIFLFFKNYIVLGDEGGQCKIFDRSLRDMKVDFIATQLIARGENLFYLNSKEVVHIRMRNQYHLPFTRIDKSKVYSEKEDEFDLSDSTYRDFD
ncbi:hypothetical protein ECANGB1_1963 [Enterospora canceri]|uniref:Uncharacterized protein n=1 Tax=Enterospora canceri TaxID=1081671 RepID=A0A1Y1S580_9MICR|nr:hypothetical protein ECANGB1_1963 [Enterospora canceri]